MHKQGFRAPVDAGPSMREVRKIAQLTLRHMNEPVTEASLANALRNTLEMLNVPLATLRYVADD